MIILGATPSYNTGHIPCIILVMYDLYMSHYSLSGVLLSLLFPLVIISWMCLLHPMHMSLSSNVHTPIHGDKHVVKMILESAQLIFIVVTIRSTIHYCMRDIRDHSIHISISGNMK